MFGEAARRPPSNVDSGHEALLEVRRDDDTDEFLISEDSEGRALSRCGCSSSNR